MRDPWHVGVVGLTGLVALVLLGWYLSYTASRLDRLHHKVIAARTALEVHLLRRAGAALDAGRHLDPASALLVADAATRCVAAVEDDGPADPLAVPPDLEPAESDLSRMLHLAYPGGPGTEPADAFDAQAREALARACAGVQMARRFHNEAVDQAQRVRRKRVVRWLHLAGRAPMPQMIEIDDELPPGLGF